MFFFRPNFTFLFITEIIIELEMQYVRAVFKKYKFI
jgi:hypothetical protein